MSRASVPPSPADGRFVYYAKEDVQGLWRVPAEGGEEAKVLDGVRQGAWAVWEQGVYFVNPEARRRPSIVLYVQMDQAESDIILVENFS